MIHPAAGMMMPPPNSMEEKLKEILESLRKEIWVWEYLMGSGCAWIPLATLVVVSLLLWLTTKQWLLAGGIGVGATVFVVVYVFYTALVRTEVAMDKYSRQFIEIFGPTSKERPKVMQVLKAWGEAGDKQAAEFATSLKYMWLNAQKEQEAQAKLEREQLERDIYRPDEDRS